jgi:hypothetical protein
VASFRISFCMPDSRDHHASPTLGDGSRLVNECGEVVPVKFAAEYPVQVGLFHGVPLVGEEAGGQNNTTRYGEIVFRRRNRLPTLIS